MPGLEIKVSGGDKLKLAAAQIKAVGDKPRGRRMGAALTAATKPLETEVRAEAARVMPGRGGYRDVFVPALRFATSVRAAAREAAVRFKTFADGKGERRDVPRLEKGELRHPVFGRSRTVRGRGRIPNPWSTTSIRSGFHSRGTQRAADLAEREMTTVLDEIIDDLKG
jgi:hypothetical protein